MKLNKTTTFLLGYYLSIVVYWLGLQASNITDLPINLTFSLSLTFLVFFGSVFGLSNARHWGGLRSAVGKGILLLSAGSFVWSIGSFIWSFYNFVLKIEVPYPSLADLGYSGAIPLWIVGIIYLSKATGVRSSLSQVRGRFLIIFLPILAALISYYFLFVVARDSSFVVEGGILKIFFDFLYPIGDWAILTIALIVWGLSLKYLGGRFKWPVLITLAGFLIMFFADFSFSYTTTIGEYFNGNISDLFFATAHFVITFGINSFDIDGD